VIIRFALFYFLIFNCSPQKTAKNAKNSQSDFLYFHRSDAAAAAITQRWLSHCIFSLPATASPAGLLLLHKTSLLSLVLVPVLTLFNYYFLIINFLPAQKKGALPLLFSCFILF